MKQLDVFLFQFINNFSHKNQLLDFLSIFFAQYLIYLLMGFLVLLFILTRKDKMKVRLMIMLSFLAGLLSRFLVKALLVDFIKRARPFIFFHNISPLIMVSQNEYFQSFPSGHIIFLFALSTVLYRLNKKLGIVFFLSSSIVGMARIFVGIHWPSDIIAGAILGFLTGLITYKLYKFLEPKVIFCFKTTKNNS